MRTPHGQAPAIRAAPSANAERQNFIGPYVHVPHGEPHFKAKVPATCSVSYPKFELQERAGKKKGTGSRPSPVPGSFYRELWYRLHYWRFAWSMVW